MRLLQVATKPPCEQFRAQIASGDTVVVLVHVVLVRVCVVEVSVLVDDVCV